MHWMALSKIQAIQGQDWDTLPFNDIFNKVHGFERWNKAQLWGFKRYMHVISSQDKLSSLPLNKINPQRYGLSIHKARHPAIIAIDPLGLRLWHRHIAKQLFHHQLVLRRWHLVEKKKRIEAVVPVHHQHINYRVRVNLSRL